eukprot:UN34226
MVWTFDKDPHVDSLFTILTHSQFKFVSTLAMWFICIFTGLCTEICIGTRLVTEIEENNLHWLWIYAQTVFALFLMVAFYSKSAFGIPFAVLGLFKLGFPEVISHFHRALHIDISNFAFWSDMMGGCGLLLHHCGAIWLILLVCLELVPLKPEFEVILILLTFQHIAAVVQYFHFRTYVIIELILE